MSAVEVSGLVRAAMVRGGLSYRDVADRSGLALGYVHRVARGRVAQPSPATLRSLAGALDVTYAALMRAAGYL